jgi:hypothetical protein
MVASYFEPKSRRSLKMKPIPEEEDAEGGKVFENFALLQIRCYKTINYMALLECINFGITFRPSLNKMVLEVLNNSWLLQMWRNKSIYPLLCSTTSHYAQ